MILKVNIANILITKYDFVVYSQLMTKNVLNTIKTLLNQPKKIVVIPHQNPDGDAIGSSLGLAIFLEKLAHNVTVIAPNDYPDFLKWLPQSKRVIQFELQTQKATDLLKEADLIFILDFNALHRVGAEMETVLKELNTKMIMIDHHQQPDDFTDLVYTDTSICSTCQMIYQFIEKLDQLNKIDGDIATCLYTGIMTDTGSFKFNSTTSNTHRITAELIDKGANNSEIHNQVYDTNTYGKLQLLGRALSNLRVLSEYKTAYISITEADKKEFDFKKGDTEGFVNYGLSINDVVLAVIFIEDAQQGIVKMSLRSKGNFSVNELARKYFNGGGHNNAAGGRQGRTMEEAIKFFIDILPEYKLELNK